MDDHVFTVILDWLAFTVPQATVDEIRDSWVANGLRRRQAFAAIPCAG